MQKLFICSKNTAEGPAVNKFLGFHIERTVDIKGIFFLKGGPDCEITELAKSEVMEKIYCKGMRRWVVYIILCS